MPGSRLHKGIPWQDSILCCGKSDVVVLLKRSSFKLLIISLDLSSSMAVVSDVNLKDATVLRSEKLSFVELMVVEHPKRFLCQLTCSLILQHIMDESFL